MAKISLILKVILFEIFVSNGHCPTIALSVTTAQSTTASSSQDGNSIKVIWNHIDLEHLNNAHFVGDLILKLSIFLYSCLAIAFLCDEFFVSSLEYIGQKFHLQPDITGSILIPIATSGPEIFSSAIGVFFTSNDIGTGAIIGSAVFNLLAIPSACGLAVAYFIGKPITLDALPILRDSFFYILSIIVLILVIKDNRVDLIDSSLLTLLFLLYVGIMAYNAKLTISSQDQQLDIETSKSEQAPLLNKNTQLSQTYKEQIDDGQCHQYGLSLQTSGYQEIINNKLKQIDEEEVESSIMKNCFCSIILSPVYIVFYLTMPKRWPLFTFIVSIVWLTALSYATVWSINGLSSALSIPTTISGMTILAAGSADLVTSIIVIRKQGLASMGIAAAIVSNIFAIVLGLGLPWLLKIVLILVETSGDFSRASIDIESDALPYISIVLLIIIFAFLLSLKLCSWKLYIKFSLICGLIHLIFLGVSVSLELFVHS